MIEVFADVSCPFTHVGLLRLVERRDQVCSDETVHVKAWPLEIVNGAPLSPQLVAEEIVELRRQVAPDLFRGFDAERFPVSTLAALVLVVAAYRLDDKVGERISLALRHALFEDGRDISSPDVLAEIGAEHNVRVDALDGDRVLAEWREGQRRGVVGSPYFFADGEGFFCPSLDIEHVGGRLRVRPDDEQLERFLEVALR